MSEKVGLYKDGEYWIETYTGRKFNPLHIADDSGISIIDIAHALSLKCRFAGHCSTFYSVAEHSLRVEAIVRHSAGSKPNNLIAALMHDAAEAYLGDIARPVKYAIKGIKEIEDRLLGAILTKCGIVSYDAEAIVVADAEMLKVEAHNLMPSIEGWELPDNLSTEAQEMFDSFFPILDAKTAERRFLDRFKELIMLRAAA